MPHYQAPLRDQMFVMHEVLNVGAVYADIPKYAGLDADTLNQVVDAAGKFCGEVLFPLNRSGDEQGCHFDAATNTVRTPKGFRTAWEEYCAGGWPALGADPEFGGQGLPLLVQNALYEMLYSTNQAWAMYPGLTTGAYECLHAHGTPAQKNDYLPKLVSGEWMGTMCLTEAHCGTDLGLIRTRAEPQEDGSYRLTGNKIFISSGEHDMTTNIVHLVLAKLPGAPAGTKGISLFLVPKFLLDSEAQTGERNRVLCTGIEHKMGIHANSTCQISLDGATGYLVSEPNKGLNAMFVMMNGARLGVGMQGLGLNEVAYQNAAIYARERLQGRSLKGVVAADKPADPIIVHPDVRRMLLTARAYAEGGRMMGYWVALELDKSLTHPDPVVRKESGEMVALMTPIVKAFMTDNGFQSASLAMQVYGGHGYIRESGVEQYVRDARINMIYEGTNAIQALDLLGRKVLRDNGAVLRRFGEQVAAFVDEHDTDPAMKEFISPLVDLGDKVTKLSMEIGMKAFGNPDEVGAAAVDYLRVLGHLVYAYFWARAARVALDHAADNDPFYQAKLATARFYFARLLPETAFHITAARSGVDVLTSMDAALF
ncbi:acyl-CoA dehydrogenase [Pigmentiphaga aceris]|uniref:3-methylmercaptopropionyl-CoA dehydrogenase n=1 Tax=Pigmentiphaga aceris TaxID=1940612 RepID=A0A5C0B711_9BURK|nr:acyl-CoA dehydrogenase C-terminal domain-containing protein [Pigmentiphaga aceris]QEI08467.1 acyl-CoA dehydrogenase [Pigmentiphaga aceris]